MGGGGGSSQNWDAGNLFASVARDQYATGRALARPLEQQLSASLGGAGVPEALDQVDESVGRAFGAQRAGLGLDMARRGVTPDPMATAASNRQFGLSEASARVGLRNGARLAVRDREQSILGGGLGQNTVASTMTGAK